MEYPQVALDFMNHAHAEFVALRTHLLALLAQHADDSAIDAALDELLDHTTRHFADEENKMQEARFPPYPMHKMEHDRVLEDMNGHVAKWRQNRDAAALQGYLEGELADWFVGHVSSMDFVTARFLAA